MISVSLVMAGCQARYMSAAYTPPPGTSLGPPEPGILEAGTARVDITPPPGASLFGHGPGARVSIGYWTRLYCRAFYLATQGQLEPGLALVTCDLPQMSTIVHRRALLRLMPSLPPSNLVLFAVHTHAGPGHFSGAPNLDGIASSHFPGYDDGMVDFLADRIASAVTEARQSRRLARMRWTDSRVWQLTQNRNISAYRANVPELMERPAGPAGLTAEEQAVDPTLRVLELEAVDPLTGQAAGPIGMLAFFAMHPTVVGNTNRYYGGDVFGIATRRVEAELRAEWALRRPDLAHRWYSAASGDYGPIESEPVVGVFNTNFGDLTPVRLTPTSQEAIRLGERLARRIWSNHCALATGVGATPLTPDADLLCAGTEEVEVWARPWRTTVTLGTAYMEATLPGARLLSTSVFPGARQLCDEPALGWQAALGASDHPTFLAGLLPSGFRTAATDPSNCHSPKRPLVTGGFPTQVPLTLVRLDDTFVSAVPAELTITAGAEVNHAVLEATEGLKLKGGGSPDAVVAGIANGYIQYVATRLEYQLQGYEAASTLYGPWTSEYLAQCFGALARAMDRGAGDGELEQLMNAPGRKLGQADSHEYETGPERERLWRASWDAPIAAIASERKNPRNVQVCRLHKSSPPEICMQWVDGGPGVVPLGFAPWIELAGVADGSVTRVAASNLVGPSEPSERRPLEPVDDRGYFFFTRAVEPVEKGYRWATLFRPSSEVWSRLPAGLLQLRVRGNELESVVSEPFTRDGKDLRPCSLEETRQVCAAP